MIKRKEPVNTSAAAVSAWISEVQETHREIQRELTTIRQRLMSASELRAVDRIMDALDRLRSITPTPRMVGLWVNEEVSHFWN